MIRLTGERQEIVMIAPEHITCIKVTSQGNTGINFADGYAIVTESPSEVARKVLEYKLLMEQYRACQHNHQLEDAGYIQNDLMRLAGLEDTNAET